MQILDVKQGSEEWLQAKVGILGGTRIKKIVTPKQLKISSAANGMVFRLVDENITGISAETFFSTQAADRGTELEPLARAEYIKRTGTEIIEHGMWLRDGQLLHGCSPDGSTTDFKGAIEIKCLGGENHLKYIEDNVIPDEHFLQVLNYFSVNEKLEWLDFVLFRPEFYPKQFHVIRVTREQLHESINKLTDAVDEFFVLYRNKINTYLF